MPPTKLIAFTLLLLCSHLPAATLDVRAFGAAGDGKTVDTLAIQKAIDACTAEGGGTVKFTAGKYLTGSIILKDNVTLQLTDQATLLGNPDLADYKLLDEFKDGTGQTRGYTLIGAADAKNVAIEGGGTIDGQGAELLRQAKATNSDRKPFLVRWVRCTGVSVKGVTLKNSAAWTMHLFQSRDVDIADVTIDGHVASNNDGIDIDSSQSVRITNCRIDTGDDAICLKTTSPQSCEQIRIDGCTLKSNCGAIKFGTESVGDFQDVQVTRCHVLYAGLGAIKLLSVDGAKLQKVAISDITIDSGHVAIFMRFGARLKTFRPGDTKRPVGSLGDITIKNLKGKIDSPGILISGIPDHPIQNVNLQNIDLTLPGQGTREEAAAVLEEKPSAYPEIRMFGKLIPACGMFARHVDGLSIENLKLSLTAPDARPAVVCDQTHDLNFTTWTLSGTADSQWLIRLINTQRATLKNITSDDKTQTLLRVEGAGSAAIYMDKDSDTPGRGVSLGNDVPADAVQR